MKKMTNCAKLATASLDVDTLPNLPASERFIPLSKNVLGRITIEQVEPETEECYVLTNRNLEPLHIWPISTPIEQIDAEMKEHGWTRFGKGDNDSYSYIHSEAVEALFDVFVEGCRTNFIHNRFIIEELPFMGKSKSVPDIPNSEFGFIRFGEIPENGLSYSSWSGDFEKGVACFDAEVTHEGDYRLINMTYTLYSVYMDLMEESPSRPVYRLYGDVIGHGWNGEPLVKVEKSERLTGKDLNSLETAREAAIEDMLLKFLN